jgi:hypothetical protein
MKGFRCRLRLIGLAGILAAGLGTGAAAATAAPAFAANGPCYDVTNSQPTPMHFYASASSKTIKFLNNGSTVTGTCDYFDNAGENRWYMRVNYIGPDNNGGYGYIWVQRLRYGSGHNCRYYSGQWFSIGTSYADYGGIIPCPLY